jgi:hypothetical protein
MENLISRAPGVGLVRRGAARGCSRRAAGRLKEVTDVVSAWREKTQAARSVSAAARSTSTLSSHATQATPCSARDLRPANF